MATWKETLQLIDKVSEPLKKIHGNMQRLTDTSKKVTKAIAGFSVGVVAVGGALIAGANKVADYGDRIDKMSQKIGMSSKAFQEWDYIMSQNGGNVESLQMGFKTLANQMGNATKGNKASASAFKKLGVSIKDNTGKLKSQDQVFNDTVRALQKLKNPTEKAILSNQLFGRSALEMKPLLNQEAEAIDNLREKANKLGLVISEEDLQNAVKYKDTMDTFSRFFEAKFATIAMKIIPKLTTGIEKIIEVISNIKQYIDKYLPILIGIATTLGIICGPAIYAGLVAIVATITSLNLPLIAIGVLIGGLVTGIVYLWKNWDKVWSNIKSAIANTISSIIEWVKKAITWISELLDKLGMVAYLIPGLGQLKLAKDIAGAVSNKINNNTTNNSSNSINGSYNTTTNNYYSTPNQKPMYTTPALVTAGNI